MNLIGKVAIGVGAAGGLGGAGFALQQHLAKEYISDKLVADGYQILSESSNDEWTAILKSYHTTVSTSNNLKFDDFKGEAEKESELKAKCKEVLTKLSSDKDNYKKASKWCVVPKTIFEWLPKDKYTKLSTDENNDQLNQTEWNDKIDKHNIKNENTSHRFTNLEGVTQDNITKDNKGRLAMKKKCKELESKKHHEPTFESDLEKAKLWCYVEKNTKQD